MAQKKTEIASDVSSEANIGSDLEKIYEGASKISLKEIAPSEIIHTVSPSEIQDFLKNLSDSHGIAQSEAFIAFALLSLKGACNASAPNDMSVDIVTESKDIVQITKYDISYACHRVTGNQYTRRLAQAMAIPISQYAEKNNLNGDLAQKLNNMALANGENPLNTKEKSWASSFCQGVSNLETRSSERIPKLLAEDYQKRFGKKKAPTAKEKKESLTPRKWRDTGSKNNKTPPKEGETKDKKPLLKKK